MVSLIEKQFVTVTTPILAFFILLEIVLSWYFEKKIYSVGETSINILFSALNLLLDIAIRGFSLLVLIFFSQFSFYNWANTGFLYWFFLFIAEDFMYYLLHYVDHYCRFFWAIHVTHHSSEEFNITTGFRSSVFQPLYRFIYFIPLTLFGFEPIHITFMYALCQTYGTLIHTQYVKKLGPLEWILATPSHHRVHHASNIPYLDKNMGMVLIIWDKLFGTFAKEKETVKYGLTQNINTHHPIKAIFHEWIAIAKDLKTSNVLKHKFMYIFGPPGWSHDGSKKTSKQLRIINNSSVDKNSKLH